MKIMQPCVYIVTNKKNGTLYTGVTSNLIQRIHQHKQGLSGFTGKYGCNQLVWFELHDNMENAILREKQIKAGNRKRKLDLIDAMNPEWLDLADDIVG